MQVLVGHPDYEVTGGSVVFKGENLVEMEPEERSLAGLFMSFQSPVAIPGVNNIDFLNMAYNARRRKLGLPELGPIEVYLSATAFIFISVFDFVLLLYQNSNIPFALHVVSLTNMFLSSWVLVRSTDKGIEFEFRLHQKPN